MSKKRAELGDWQTPITLALKVCHLIKQRGISPTTLVEPTCGQGHFIQAALEVFDSIKEVYAIEIQNSYIKAIKNLERAYPNITFYIHNESIFNFKFEQIKNENLLLLGNPPWVTNSHIGVIDGDNLPQKNNLKGHRGLDAITGKSNFDISEFIMLSLWKAFSTKKGTFAFLLKNSVIRNLVYEETSNYHIGNLFQYKIDAKREFGASTEASLFIGDLGDKEHERVCQVYDLYTNKYIQTFGCVGQLAVSDIISYRKYPSIDGKCPFMWRSGIKHDCAKIMELNRIQQGHYINGLKQHAFIEEDLVYPLIKSSDISKRKEETRKYVLITQRKTSEDTGYIKHKYPQTYHYLETYATFLDGRKSSIYRNRPPFCLFGIGEYSFLPYKVAISSLYKSTVFTLLRTIGGKATMIDDTCYSIGFHEEEFAIITLNILNSTQVQDFISSISSTDSKRVITKDILMRIDILKAMSFLTNKELNITEEQRSKYIRYIHRGIDYSEGENLLFET